MNYLSNTKNYIYKIKFKSVQVLHRLKNKLSKNPKPFITLVLSLTLIFTLGGCAITSKLKELKGDLIGESFCCMFYDNSGNKILTVNGRRVNLSGNRVRQRSYNSDGKLVKSYELSSVVTIDIDGHQISSCGDTIIFAETGLQPAVDFKVDTAGDKADGGIGELTSVSGIVNRFANFFGKSRVVVIQSQLGDPICAYCGDSVYWEISDDLPKTTRLVVDGKSMYIHRANFQIIDRALIH